MMALQHKWNLECERQYRSDGSACSQRSNSSLEARKESLLDGFTICLFISPDLDGHRAPKNGSFTLCEFKF
jgi:hypothetical protein